MKKCKVQNANFKLQNERMSYDELVKKSEGVTSNEERGLSTYCKAKISHVVRNDK